MHRTALRRGCAFARFAHRTGDWTPQARTEPWTGTRFRSAASILTTRAIALLRADTRAFALRVTSSAGTRREFGEEQGGAVAGVASQDCCNFALVWVPGVSLGGGDLLVLG